jgi:N-acetylmuramoyl-L-alanine amidase
MKKYTKIITIFLCFIWPFTFSTALSPLNAYKVKTVVIDAGHGGHDSGCLGASSKEKEITLALALQLGHYIETKLPDVQVIYTRKTDKFVALEERAAIANRNKADLFISIHCNAAASKTAYGAETYVMGLHKTDDNLAVAKRENSVMMLEDNYKEIYNFDPSSPEAYIMLSLNQNAYLEQSTLFASLVQNEFRDKVGRHDRGVKQAGFWVLHRTAMPAVLIEAGFLTNNTEESFLRTQYGQDLMASAMFRAFRDYKTKIESNQPLTKIVEKVKIEEVKEIQTTEVYEPKKDELYFNVQFMATKSKVDLNDSKLKNVPSKKVEVVNDIYRYMSGPFNSYQVAQNILAQIKSLGYKDAFIVPYKNNQRLNLKDVEHLLK